MTRFDSLFKETERLDDYRFKCSSAKRATLIIPDGYSVFDIGADKWFYGDGSTVGGKEVATV
jgi:hypothetical protein